MPDFQAAIVTLSLSVETPGDRIPFTPLDELPLNICYGPAIESDTTDGWGCVSLVRLTHTTDLLHHTWTD